MTYNIREYKPKFDTPMKREQEICIVNIIMDLLNKNKYNNLDDFISKNSNYQDFLKKNYKENVVKHFGNSLEDKDYIFILKNLEILTKQKKSFDSENIKITIIDDKEYVSYHGEYNDFFFDNSNSNKNIEDQMKDVQPTQDKFQSPDIKNNTENIMKELMENKKEVLDLHYLNEIDYNSLNAHEKNLYEIARNYQIEHNSIIKIDLGRALIVDENNTIIKIENENGELNLNSGKINENNSKENSKQFTKTLSTTPITLYSND